MDQQTRDDMIVLLEEHFACKVQPDALSADSFLYMQQILTDRILRLVQHDWDKLMSSLYRIDVNEDLVQRAFKEYGVARAPEHIAAMIIKRLMKKAQSRQEWRKKQ